MQMNINLEDTTEITCNECGSNIFQQGMLLRSISRFITGGTQDSVMPLAVFYCTKCGHVNQQFLPQTKPSAGSPSVEDVSDKPKKTPFSSIIQ